MGRNRKGPVRLNGGSTWYARLTVPPKLREQAGKTRLIRSLKTDNHGEALRRYGAVYAELERELGSLIEGGTFRARIEVSQEGTRRNGDAPLTPLELTEIELGPIDPDNPVHQDVYDFHASGKEIPISWDEALEKWVQVKNRENPRPLSEGSIKIAKRAADMFASFASPSRLTKTAIRKYIEERERTVEPSTVSGELKMLKTIIQTCVEQDLLENNAFNTVKYTVTSRNKWKACTDDQLRLLYREAHPLFTACQYGMRGGEIIHGDVDGEIMVIKPVIENGEEIWRPKTLSSHRRCPLLPDFVRPLGSQKAWGRSLRHLIKDPLVVMHSGRHTHEELSRRAGADQSIVAEYCGWGSKQGSQSQRGYGAFPDEVMLREIKKVWELIDEITGTRTS